LNDTRGPHAPPHGRLPHAHLLGAVASDVAALEAHDRAAARVGHSFDHATVPLGGKKAVMAGMECHTF